MRKTTLILIGLLISGYAAFSQYQVGHKQITYTDPARSNRQIQTELYYPSNQSGDDVAIASGEFPVIVFGHGFVMVWSSYQFLWDSIVPRGYIMAFPRTEGSMSPNHTEFGADLRFLNQKLKEDNTNSGSFFYQKIASSSAIMGHSMGGGCTFLASENNTDITTMITFAAAVTSNNSSITAAQNISVPALVFSGSNDCVAPPDEHQIPMYDSLSSNCKTLISITGGGHCYFADYNFNCSFGEGTCSPSPDISREEQHDVIIDLLIPYLNFMLKGNPADESIFLDSLSLSQRIIVTKECISTIQNEINKTESIKIYPIPANDQIFIETQTPSCISIIDIKGNTISYNEIARTKNILYVGNLTSGIYFLKIQSCNQVNYRKFIVK